MTEFDFRYNIPSLPPPIAESYLKRNFGRKYQFGGRLPISLFIRYFKGDIPDSYRKAIRAFPENCFLSEAPERPKSFVIAADSFTFARIYTYLESLSCQTLYQEVHAEVFLNTEASEFKIRNQIWRGDRPKVMAILNITPDSFYDGGRYFNKPDYVEIADKMIQNGADVIDIGGESTRPGSDSVSADEEIRRILPAVRQIRKRFQIPISIDTTKPEVAKAMFEEGADMINDISGLSASREMIDTINEYKGSYCLMHILGTPQTMQKKPEYSDLLAEVYQFLSVKLAECLKAGMEKSRILLDPGIGFGKTVIDNMDLLNFLPAFSNMGCATLIGTSNKSFIGRVLDRGLDQRLAGSLATQIFGWTKGALVFRVHAVQETSDVLKISSLYTNGYELQG